MDVWNFDGSSTNQSSGNFSDVFLKPVKTYRDPFRGDNSLLVLCECYDDAELKNPNKFNIRHKLASLQDKYAQENCWAGLEQEYVIMDKITHLPYQWINHVEPGCGGQGPYYCGYGGNKIFGRDLIEEHMNLCIDAGLEFAGTNAEVLPS